MSQKNTTIRRFHLVALSTVLLLVTVLSACSNSENAPPGGTSPGEDGGGEPFTLSIMMGSTLVEFPQPGNDIQKRIEEYTNTKLDIQAYPDQTLHEMMPAIISSGDLPMALSFGGSQLSQSYMINAMRAGVFWDIKPYLDQFPNLSQINPLTFENYEVSGEILGLPKVRSLSRFGVCYRTDWAENLGLGEPKTIEEFYEMARAFSEDDPDGNGVDDTYGLTKFFGASTFGIWYGAPNGWDIRDGEFIRDVETPEYLEALKFEKRLFDEGILHPEYFIMNRSQYEELLLDGKAGMYMNITGCTNYEEAIKERNPDGELGVFSLVEGPDGLRIAAERGHNGIIAFPKSSVRSEEDLLKVLNFFDKYADEEMANLMTWGIEGEHYEVVDGKAMPIEGMNADLADRIKGPYSATLGVIPHLTYAMEGERHRLDIRAAELNEENEQYAVPNPALGLISETHSQRGSDLDQLISDANVKFVTGALDEAGWENEIKRWRSSGGQAIAEEYMVAYEER